MPWTQLYDPLQSPLLSTLAALLPLLVLLGGLAFLHIRAHTAAFLGLACAAVIVLAIYRMPLPQLAASAIYGAVYGLLPIGWIILNVIFLYRLANNRRLFDALQASLTSITQDRRLQLLLVAFCVGAFFEGAAGFGTPVAITAAILIGLGFPPLQASGLSLIANTAPVAFGGLGTPLVALQSVTGLDLLALSATTGTLLAPFAVLVPFWMTAVFSGWRRMLEIWPALLITGASFSLVQWLTSRLHGPWLVDVAAALVSAGLLILFLRFWRPSQPFRFAGDAPAPDQPAATVSASVGWRTWAPWAVLSLLVFTWGLPQVKAVLDQVTLAVPVPFLDQLVYRVPPVVESARLESAVFRFSWLSATGTAIFLSAVISGLILGYRPLEMLQEYGRTLRQVRFSLLTIALMMALGFVTRYAGLDATLGLAFSRAGSLYPLFGTLLGWLGVAITGSDTSSNVLFGSLQIVTARQLNLDPLLMASANSAGGVMGKMIDAQSIVVASTATRYSGHEGEILRFVFLHSLALAILMGLLVLVIS